MLFEVTSPHIFLFAKEGLLSDDDVGVARGTVYQEFRPGPGF